MRKILALVCAVLVMLNLSGCAMLDGDIDTLLAPPSPSGELRQVQLALESSITGEYTLKYPTSGDYRSAIILKDLNGDKTQEALVFYSTTLENTTNMHINLIAKKNEEWVSCGSATIVASGVEKVSFSDMNGDGVLEILVGWSIYGAVEKTLGVYSITENGFASRILENYTTYICRDFNRDGTPDIFLIYQNTNKGTSTAKLLDLSEEGAEDLGSCPLDPAVTEYADPVIFELENKVAVYLDGKKGSGLITEMIIIDSGLSNLSYSADTTTAFDTFRSDATPITDIDSDGNFDVPISFLITEAADDPANNIHKTNWYHYNGTSITLTESTIMNYPEGYYLEIPEKWDSGVTITGNSAQKTRSVYRIDKETGNSAEQLLFIQSIAKGSGNAPLNSDSVKLCESDRFIYYISLGTYEGEEAITMDELKELFKITN